MIGRIRGRLATRVAIAASGLALFFVLLMGGGAWLVTAQMIRSQVNDLLLIEASGRAEKVTDLVEGVAANFRVLAANTAVANALVDSIGRETYLQPLLSDMAEVNGLRTTLMVTDFVGRPLVGSVPPGDHEADSWVAGAVASGRTRVKVADSPDGPILKVAEPVIYANTGTAEGALVWKVAVMDLARRVAAQSGALAGELRVEADGRSLAVPLGRGLGGGGQNPVVAEVHVPLNPRFSVIRMSIRMAADQQALDNSLGNLTTTFLAIGAVSTLLVVLFSALLGQRLTQALSQLAEAATVFEPGTGDRRVFMMEGDDEIARLGAAFAGMVERLDAAYQDLERRSQTLLSNAERVAQVGSATWEFASGRQLWSDQFHTLLGVVPGEEIPTRATFFRRVHDDDRERLSAALDLALSGAGNGRVIEDVRIVRPDGEERVGQFRAEVARDEAGLPLRVDVTIQDITARKQLEHKLDALVLELRRSNEELEQFAYVASHDLRQPLRTVRSYVTLIEEAIDDKLDVETREFMEFIRDGVRRMDALITDLLAYSRVGRTSTDAPVDTGRAADLALIDLQSEIDEAHAQITMPPRMPVVLGDAGEMARLFQNLIGNALKYRSHDRPSQVVVKFADQGEQWEFSVADNGIGIPPEHAERVFGIFQRLHARDEYEGTGIGLAICRKVVERQGGRIWFEPHGSGTMFRFTWPKLRRLPELVG
ncbi:MAG: PAS domain-containing protein [Rhodospirillaceae bacterium]|nr:PAS domain-containing protein [Rhodospirillales bacterium]